MADNYLEKKMEELRRGPEKTYTGRKAVQRKGFVQFAFPPKRVVIASEIPCRNSIARTFLKADCKVAMIHPFQEEGEKMAHDEGVRYYPICVSAPLEDSPDHLEDSPDHLEATSNPLKGNLKEAFENLLSAWRDVDIIIADKEAAMVLLPLWKKHREWFPYVSSYTCRLIVFGNADIEKLQEATQGIKTTVNIIESHESQKDLSELILTLSLPGNDILNGITIRHPQI